MPRSLILSGRVLAIPALATALLLGLAGCEGHLEGGPGPSGSPDGGASADAGADAGGRADAAGAPDRGRAGADADVGAADAVAVDGTGGADLPPGDQGGPPGPDAGPPVGPAYPAQPAAGTIYWGAAVEGNGDPVPRHETPSGQVLGLRRTFFRWDQRTSSLLDIVDDDLARGRLPWVSVKPPSWAEMAAGDHDSELDQLLTGLASRQGPVWLTFHHEPEGGGGVNAPDDPAGPAGHLAMNRRVRERMTALGVRNVALALILMSYTWNPTSDRDPDAWWAEGVYDLLGIDHYRDQEASLLTPVWMSVRQWAGARGVDIAIGEWGVRGSDAAAGVRVAEWYEHAIGSASDGMGARVVGLSAFDSALNSPTGSWELQGGQLTTFRTLLGDARTARLPLP